MQNPFKIDDFGVPLFLETPISPVKGTFESMIFLGNPFWSHVMVSQALMGGMFASSNSTSPPIFGGRTRPKETQRKIDHETFWKKTSWSTKKHGRPIFLQVVSCSSGSTKRHGKPISSSCFLFSGRFLLC